MKAMALVLACVLCGCGAVETIGTGDGAAPADASDAMAHGDADAVTSDAVTDIQVADMATPEDSLIAQDDGGQEDGGNEQSDAAPQGDAAPQEDADPQSDALEPQLDAPPQADAALPQQDASPLQQDASLPQQDAAPPQCDAAPQTDAMQGCSPHDCDDGDRCSDDYCINDDGHYYCYHEYRPSKRCTEWFGDGVCFSGSC